MNKIINTLAISFLLVIVLFIPLHADAYGAEYYNTNEYNVTMDVASDNSFLLKEEINVTFTEPRHGIYRYIPLSGTAHSQVDGKLIEQNYKMKVENISVEGYEYQVYQENGNAVIQIGSPDYLVEGNQSYIITYRVRLYDDGISGYDSLYYNVIPNGWGTTIAASKIIIQMPKEFDSSKAEFLAGAYGATDSGSVKWNISENLITGEIERPIQLGEGITFRVVLPEGYFTGEMNTNWAYIIMLLLCIVAPLISLLLWFSFGRDPKVVKTVEFNAPDGISPAEVGYIVDGIVDEKDLVSLVIYFAEEGYLTIEEIDKGEFILIKKKEMGEEAKIYESTFFEGLFNLRDSVTLNELKDDFFSSYQAAAVQLKAHFTKSKKSRIFTQNSIGARALGMLLMLIPIAGIAILYPIYLMIAPANSIVSIPILFIILAGYSIVIAAHDKRDANSKIKYKSKVIAGGTLAGLGLAVFIGYGIVFLDLMMVIFSVVASVISFIFTIRMKQRTKRSAELLGKILGFKEFIRTAELDRIKILSEENPSYFYNVLPYAYVLGLNEKWAKHFEGIAVEPPIWYGGGYNNTLFNTWIFMNMFNGFTNSMASTIVAPQAGDGSGGLGSGGFSGGGGFGGGGFGGGGGGSW
jgi:uncharacterized membrane protein YgcG